MRGEQALRRVEDFVMIQAAQQRSCHRRIHSLRHLA